MTTTNTTNTTNTTETIGHAISHALTTTELAFLDTVATAIYTQGGSTASQAYDYAHKLLEERRRYQETQ